MKAIKDDVSLVIFTHSELKSMLEFSEKEHDKNICLVYSNNNIGTLKGVCLQNELNNKPINEIDFKDVTDYDSW